MALSFSLLPGTRDPCKSWNEAMPACMIKEASKTRSWCSQNPNLGAKTIVPSLPGASGEASPHGQVIGA